MAKTLKIIIGVISLIAIGFLLLILGGRSFKLILEDKTVFTEEQNKNKSAVAALGSEAPYFELSDLSGARVRLADLTGVPLIITFWATWQSDSADQIKLLDDYLTRHPKPLFRLIAINTQEDKSVARVFMRRGGYSVTTLLDVTGAVGRAYGTKTLPVSYFIDRDGIIRYVHYGVMSEKIIGDKSETILR